MPLAVPVAQGSFHQPQGLNPAEALEQEDLID